MIRLFVYQLVLLLPPQETFVSAVPWISSEMFDASWGSLFQASFISFILFHVMPILMIIIIIFYSGKFNYIKKGTLLILFLNLRTRFLKAIPSRFAFMISVGSHMVFSFLILNFSIKLLSVGDIVLTHLVNYHQGFSPLWVGPIGASSRPAPFDLNLPALPVPEFDPELQVFRHDSMCRGVWREPGILQTIRAHGGIFPPILQPSPGWVEEQIFAHGGYGTVFATLDWVPVADKTVRHLHGTDIWICFKNGMGCSEWELVQNTGNTIAHFGDGARHLHYPDKKWLPVPSRFDAVLSEELARRRTG